VDPIRTSFEADARLMMASYRACHRRGYLIRCVAAGAMVLIGLVTPGHLLVIAGPVYWVVMELSVRRQLRRQLEGTGPISVTITDEGYRTERGDRTTARSWATFARVDRVGAFWVLRVSSAMAMGLPVSALDDEQTASFRDLLRRTGLREGERP